GRGSVVVVAAEVDDPVLALVAAATVPRRDHPLVIATPRLLERFGQLLLGLLFLVRQLGEIADRRVAPPGCGRFVSANAHRLVSWMSGDRPVASKHWPLA